MEDTDKDRGLVGSIALSCCPFILVAVVVLLLLFVLRFLLLYVASCMFDYRIIVL